MARSPKYKSLEDLIETNPPITLRLVRAQRREIEQLALDYGCSSAAASVMFVECCLEMLRSGKDFVPTLVRAVRVLRENNATFTSPHQELPGSEA